MVMPQFGGIPGLPTGPQSFAPSLTQEQINQLSPEDLRRLEQQVNPGPQAARPTARQQLQGYIGKSAEVLSAIPGQVKQAAGDFRTRFPQAGAYARGGLAIAGALPAVGTSLEELQAGRPLGAVAALAPAGLSAAGAALIGKGPLGTVAGLGLMGLGAVLPGTAAKSAESAKRKQTGEPTAGDESFSNQLARSRQIGELGTTQYRDNMGVYTSSLKDLTKAQADQEYLNLQRNIPLINQLKNADLVRQQALMNTQNQGYMQQGVLATAGSLALQSNQNVAQLTNTALQTNPYAGAIMQAPQIRFG